jgi:RimJ/RimL family protein N-acetyltransferase
VPGSPWRRAGRREELQPGGRDPRGHDGVSGPLVTERLAIGPLRAADLPAFVAYRRDPGVARFQTWEVDYSIADAERLLAELAGAGLGRVGEGVQLGLTDRADGRLVGDCFSHILAEPPGTAEIGVTLAPDAQGRGLAREAVGALVGALFEEHGIGRVVAQADDRNRAVHHVLEHVGFRLAGRSTERSKGEWTTVRRYAVLADAWRPPPASR